MFDKVVQSMNPNPGVRFGRFRQGSVRRIISFPGGYDHSGACSVVCSVVAKGGVREKIKHITLEGSTYINLGGIAKTVAITDRDPLNIPKYTAGVTHKEIAGGGAFIKEIRAKGATAEFAVQNVREGIEKIISLYTNVQLEFLDVRTIKR